MNGYAETDTFTPTVRFGDAMFIAGGINENQEKPVSLCRPQQAEPATS